jgi:hypothetical protein
MDGVSTKPPADVTDYQRTVALTWVNRGVPVVPCSRTDKGALVPGFGARATPSELAPFSDPQQVGAWWSGRFKRAHVGLLTRTLLVIDLDMLKPDGTPPAGRFTGCYGGSDVLELLARESGAPWPDTYTVLTPSGGMHLYYQQPDGEPIGCATGDGPGGPHLGPLVDVRGVGGYVIAAGSYSATQGRAYTRTSSPEIGPQPVPEWLLTLLRRPAPTRTRSAVAPVRELPAGTRAERYATAALNGAAEDVANAPAGERNNKLFAAARHLGELSLTASTILIESDVTDRLVSAAVAAGLSERTAAATVQSGWARGTTGTGRGAGAA